MGRSQARFGAGTKGRCPAGWHGETGAPVSAKAAARGARAARCAPACVCASGDERGVTEAPRAPPARAAAAPVCGKGAWSQRAGRLRGAASPQRPSPPSLDAEATAAACCVLPELKAGPPRCRVDPGKPDPSKTKQPPPTLCHPAIPQALQKVGTSCQSFAFVSGSIIEKHLLGRMLESVRD